MSLEITKSVTTEVMPDRQFLRVAMHYNTKSLPEAIKGYNNAIGLVRQAVSQVQDLTYKLGNARIVEVRPNSVLPFTATSPYVTIPFSLEAPASQNLLDYVLQVLDNLRNQYPGNFNYQVSFQYQLSDDARDEARKNLIPQVVQKCFEEARLYLKTLTQQEVSVEIPLLPKSLSIRDIYPLNEVGETVRYKAASYTAEDYHIDRVATPIPVTASMRIIFNLEM